MRETLRDPATGNARQYGPGMPLMVAELSGNHGGDLNVAYELIDAANSCGFDAVKFQYFEPEHMASLWANIMWRGKTTALRELYRRTQTPLDWFEDLFARVRTHGMLPIVSVFHPMSVALFEDNEALDPAAYKVASAECMWIELIETCLNTTKTVMVSDGNKLGLQWDHGYNRYVETDPFIQGNVIVHDGNTRADTYAPSATMQGCWESTGFFRTLCVEPDGITYVLTFADRHQWVFLPLDGSPWQGRIAQSIDRNGNSMSFSYDGTGRLSTIVDTLGRLIQVAHPRQQPR